MISVKIATMMFLMMLVNTFVIYGLFQEPEFIKAVLIKGLVNVVTTTSDSIYSFLSFF